MVSPIGGSGGVNLGSAYGEIRISDNIDQALSSALGGFDNALSAIGGQMDQVGRQMSNVGQQLTIATAPLAAFGVQGVRAAANFDEALIEIQARAGLTAEELDTVRETALQLGADTVFSTQQAADSFLQLLTAGLSTEEALATLPEVLNAAAAGGIDLGVAADTVTNVMSVFNLEAENAGEAIDAMVSAAASSPADMQQIGLALQTAGSSARNFGLDVEETAGIMAIFAQRGIRGTEAGNQLRSMLRNMSRDVPAVQAAWDEIGVSMYDADGAARDLDDVFAELRVALEDLPVEEQNRLIQRLAGAEGEAGFNALLASAGIGAMNETMRDQASAAEVAQARMGAFRNQVDSLMGSVQSLMITTLTPFMNDVLRPMVGRLIEVTNQITAWANANPELAQQIVQVLAAVTALGPVLIILGQTLSFVGGGIAGLAPLMAALTGPIGLLVVAVTALGVAYATNFAGMRDITNAAALVISGVIQNRVLPAVEQLTNGLMRLWTDVSPFLGQLANWWLVGIMPQIVDLIVNSVLPTVRDFTLLLIDIWNRAQPSLKQLYSWFIVTGLPGIMSFIEGPVTDVITIFFDLLSGAWGAVQGGVNALRDNLDAVFTFIRNNVVQPVIDLIEDLFGRFDALRTEAENAANFASNQLNAAQNTASQISIIGQGLAGGQIGLGDIFGGFADGINLLPEDGLHMLHANEAVIPADYNPYNPNARQPMDVGGGGGGMRFEAGSVVIQANSYEQGRAAARGFEEEVMRAYRENGGK